MVVSVFKVISNESNTPEILYDKIIYIMNHSATQLDYIYGVNVNPFMAYKEMIFAKKVFGKMQGNAFLHFVLSFDNEDKINFLLDKEFQIKDFKTEYILDWDANYVLSLYILLRILVIGRVVLNLTSYCNYRATRIG